MHPRVLSHILHNGYGSDIFPKSLILMKSRWYLFAKLRSDLPVLSSPVTWLFTIGRHRIPAGKAFPDSAIPIPPSCARKGAMPPPFPSFLHPVPGKEPFHRHSHPSSILHPVPGREPFHHIPIPPPSCARNGVIPSPFPSILHPVLGREPFHPCLGVASGSSHCLTQPVHPPVFKQDLT